jgi:hypothetical protein
LGLLLPSALSALLLAPVVASVFTSFVALVFARLALLLTSVVASIVTPFLAPLFVGGLLVASVFTSLVASVFAWLALLVSLAFLAQLAPLFVGGQVSAPVVAARCGVAILSASVVATSSAAFALLLVGRCAFGIRPVRSVAWRV